MNEIIHELKFEGESAGMGLEVINESDAFSFAMSGYSDSIERFSEDALALIFTEVMEDDLKEMFESSKEKYR